VEIWKPVIGFEGAYEVSNTGHVRALRFHNRNVDRALSVPRMLIASQAGRKGRYLHVGLHRNGQRHMYLVHVLVLLAFVGSVIVLDKQPILSANRRLNDAFARTGGEHAESDC
jgi:hypothetical protein